MKKIMIVDDEEDYTFFLKANIEKNSEYRVVVANSGKAALEMFSRSRPDFVILDIMMPDIDGIKVLRKLREQTRTDKNPTPIVMLSAKRETDSLIECEKYGADDYLMKPVEEKVIMQSIRKYVNLYG